MGQHKGNLGCPESLPTLDLQILHIWISEAWQKHATGTRLQQQDSLVVKTQCVCGNGVQESKGALSASAASGPWPNQAACSAEVKCNYTVQASHIHKVREKHRYSKFLSTLHRINSCPIKLKVIINKLNWEKYISTFYFLYLIHSIGSNKSNKIIKRHKWQEEYKEQPQA